MADESKAICNHCKTTLSRGGKNPETYGTSNLLKHLRTHHKTIFSELQTADETEERGQVSGKEKSLGTQQTLDGFVQNVTPFGFNHPMSLKITRYVAEMIALDNQPFSIVEDNGFKQLVEVLEPRYKLPSRRYFTEVAIPDMYQGVREAMLEFLDQVDYISCTTAIWSSVAQDSMLSLTAHCVLSDFNKISCVLQSAAFNDSYTGENIANLIITSLQSWNLEEKLVCIVRDNASSFVAGLRDADIPNIPCLSHTLQLVIDDGVLAQPCGVSLLAAGRRLVGHFKRSNVNVHALGRIQERLGLKKHRLIQDEPTRWNTSYYMLERLIEQRQAICAAEVECRIVSELNNQQWQLAEKVVKVLKPFEEATEAVSSKGSSVALTIPVVNSLVHFLDTTVDEDVGVRNMKRKMLSSF